MSKWIGLRRLKRRTLDERDEEVQARSELAVILAEALDELRLRRADEPQARRGQGPHGHAGALGDLLIGDGMPIDDDVMLAHHLQGNREHELQVVAPMESAESAAALGSGLGAVGSQAQGGEPSWRESAR